MIIIKNIILYFIQIIHTDYFPSTGARLVLSKTVKEKDLGVSMNANMKVSEQCRIAVSKGNQVLGMIRRNVTYKENSLIVPLYKAIVIPQLEYCIQAWSPYIRKDIDMIEKKYRGEQLNAFQD